MAGRQDRQDTILSASHFLCLYIFVMSCSQKAASFGWNLITPNFSDIFQGTWEGKRRVEWAVGRFSTKEDRWSRNNIRTTRGPAGWKHTWQEQGNENRGKYSHTQNGRLPVSKRDCSESWPIVLEATDFLSVVKMISVRWTFIVKEQGCFPPFWSCCYIWIHW